TKQRPTQHAGGLAPSRAPGDVVGLAVGGPWAVCRAHWRSSAPNTVANVSGHTPGAAPSKTPTRHPQWPRLAPAPGHTFAGRAGVLARTARSRGHPPSGPRVLAGPWHRRP